MKGQALFQGGDDKWILKLLWQYLKVFFTKTTEPILTKLGTDPCVKGTEVFPNKRSLNSQNRLWFFPLDQCYGKIIGSRKHVYWLELFSGWMWSKGLKI